MEFRILGPVELLFGGRSHEVRWAKERCVLAALLLAPRRPVPVDVLAERVWGADPPARARGLLHSPVARLRTRLAEVGVAARIHYRSGAYLLDTDAENVDYHRFRTLRDQARAIAASGDEDAALGLLREAAALWRGRPLGGVDGAWAERTRETLQEELLDGALDRIDLQLRRGAHADVIPELVELTARFPFRERPVELLMLALHRAGRPGEALAAYRRAERHLAAELEAAPGPGLRLMRRRILDGDAALAPPARAPVPDDLPRDVHTFTGRAAELARLTETWRRSGPAVTVLAIDGMPGVGKTALAVHLAHRLAADHPDGRLFLDLHAHDRHHPPLDASTALDRLLASLGVPRRHPQPPLPERAALLRARLAHRRMLLVLDNVLGPEQIEPLLPGAPGCLVIVTSRRRLAGLDGVRPLTLDVLPPEEAADLLGRVAGRPPAEEREAARTVARLCGYLPLALQLVGSRLQFRPGWSVADLADRLGAGDARLAQIRAGERALPAAFELSYRGLGAPSRRAFRLLGVHPGADLSADAAAALLGATRPEADALLEELVDHHLLNGPRPGRYRFHDLLREYAREVADAASAPEREAALDRLHDHYLAVAERSCRILLRESARSLPEAAPPAADPVDEERARRWLTDELDNLVDTAHHAADHGRPRYAARIAHVLMPYLEVFGHWDVAARLQERALAAWRALGDERGEARALVDLAKVHWRMGRNESALAHAHRALEIQRAAGDREAVGAVLDQIGLVHWTRSEYDEAVRCCEEALRHREGTAGRAETLGHLGIVRWHQGRYDEAADLMRAALSLYEEAGDRRGRQMTLNNLGDVERQRGDLTTALDHYRRADAVMEMSRQHRANWLNNVATVQQEVGSLEEALDGYRKALSIYTEIGDRRGETDSLVNIGSCFSLMRRDGEALIHHQKALHIARSISERHLEARALRFIGEIHHRAGRLAAADEHHTASLAVANAIGDVRLAASALDSLADVAARTHGPAQAEAYRLRALELYEGLGLAPEADAVRARLHGTTGAAGTS
ncbi:MAG TPA: tetratricopeptide repeat protein [Thermomonospora sp.]|nr:tetratricopeptide repeat protein [Thermomonospora sp.]